MTKNKVVVLSDVHIATNEPVNWYQKSLHEPYLSAILDYVIANAASIQELVLLGDIFDFWTCPPSQKPPAFADIVAANPNILSHQGKLSQALTALEGKVTYVNGNHDMNITQDDLNLIQNSSGYKIQYCDRPIYYVSAAENKKVAFTHGHTFTMFNAPDFSTPLSPLPVGHFVTRAFAYMLQKTLQPGETVADLPNQGSPNGLDISTLATTILKNPSSVVALLLDYTIAATQIPENEPILLANGQTTTMGAAKTIYGSLWSQWVNTWGGGEDGLLAAVKAAIADANGLYIAWFAQQSALTSNSNLSVLGHTHIAKLGLTNGLVQYVNNGFECAASPDIHASSNPKTISFTVIDTDECAASLYQVVNTNGVYNISSYSAPPDSVIGPQSMDYSCYIIVDNTNGKSTLNLTDFTASNGHYVVAPPKQILPGQQGRFWVQDYPGAKGSAGTADYSTDSGTLSLNFACPLGIWPNSCSGANFYTSLDGVNWSSLNQVQRYGHPFFVKFVL
ncbi:metallophosphoesterase [Phormidium sp. LEGE 05292]|uniref:metallophosphoesterase n=1 Tax=[Phormidium] sp. LEGE 05292 TaxID=767427 RepID=UPI00187F0987|nr:metallophosphoesterase [Phormidium sp. LEGE 05292]MBE9226578.1 metallophosphoesterase [Phormidium sp. LEGE 05292]